MRGNYNWQKIVIASYVSKPGNSLHIFILYINILLLNLFIYSQGENITIDFEISFKIRIKEQ